MHGRKKTAAAPLPEAVAAAKKKLETYKRLLAVAFKLRHEHLASTEALQLNGQLLVANPDVYSLWNHRREMLRELSPGKAEDAVRPLVAAELKLSADAIAKNPKSYCAWHQRQWIVLLWGRKSGARSGDDAAAPAPETLPGPEPARPLVDLEAELALCGAFLDRDERNFHCWNYRRWLADFAGVPAGAELEHTSARIARNFSNYSAWHARAHLLQRETGANRVSLDVLRGELELVRQATFTEPDDQSPWFYRRWVVGQLAGIIADGAAGSDGGASGAAAAQGAAAACILLQDCASLRELAALEPKSKWPLEALAHSYAELQSHAVKRLLASGVLSPGGSAAAASASSGDSSEPSITAEEAALIVEGRLPAFPEGDGEGAAAGGASGASLPALPTLSALYGHLARMDPLHARYYAYRAAKAAAAAAPA